MTRDNNGWTGEKIKELREKLGWTQQHFAEVLGISISAIPKWEHNTRKPRPVYQQQLNNLKRKVVEP